MTFLALLPVRPCFWRILICSTVSLAAVDMAKHTNENWSIPFTTWAATSQFADIYSRFLRSWSLQQQAAIRFAGLFSPISGTESHPKDHVVYLGTNYSAKDRVAAFPFDFGLPDQGKRITVYYPVSLIALLEGNAQAIQRSLAAAELPSHLADQFTPVNIQHRILEDAGETEDIDKIVAAVTQPYNVTDFMLSKYLRLRGKPTFDREALLRLTDITLSSCGIVSRQTDDLGLPRSFEMTEVGRDFVNQMESIPLDKIVSGDVEYPSVLRGAYSGFLESIVDFPTPEQIEYRGDLLSPLKLLESIFRHEVIAPLLQARLDSNHEVFYSVDEYMRRLPSLPKVPVIEYPNGVQFAPYMIPIAQDAWSKYVFIRRLCSELASGSHILTCARATGVVGHIADSSFCMSGECRTNIEAGNCNGWYNSSPRPLPPCLFTGVLKASGALATS